MDRSHPVVVVVGCGGPDPPAAKRGAPALQTIPTGVLFPSHSLTRALRLAQVLEDLQRRGKAALFYAYYPSKRYHKVSLQRMATPCSSSSSSS